MISFTLVGSILRAVCIYSDSFWPIAIGHYLNNCSIPFFTIVMSIIANKWFTDKERALATAIQGISIQLGCALAFGQCGYTFKEVVGP